MYSLSPSLSSSSSPPSVPARTTAQEQAWYVSGCLQLPAQRKPANLQEMPGMCWRALEADGTIQLMDSIPLFFCLFRLHRLRCSTWKIHLRLSVVEIWTPSIEAAHGSITCLAPGERKIIFSFFPSMNLTFAHELRYNISFPSRNLLNYFLIFRWISSSTFWLGNFFLVEKNNFLIVESFQFVRQSHKTSSWNDELRIAGDISQTLTNVSFLFLLKKHKKNYFTRLP